MIAHDTESIQFETVLVLTSLNSIEQHLTAFKSCETKLTIITVYLRASVVPNNPKPIFAIICNKFLKPTLAMPQDKN